MWSTHYMKTFWNHTYDWLQTRSIKLIFFVNKSIDSKKIAIFPWFFIGIPYMVLWLNVWNKELLTLRNLFVVTKMFLKANFDCTSSENVLYINCFECQNKNQFVYISCSELAVFMYWPGKSMNNLLSYCGLVDPRISASGKDLPVQTDAKNYSFLSSHTYLQLI